MDVPGILELLHLARGRYGAIDARIRTWRDPAVVRRARARWLRREEEEPKAGPRETIERVWYETEGRWRVERDSDPPQERFLHVQNGRRCWRVDPESPSHSGVFEDMRFGEWPAHGLLWEPNVLIPEMWFEPGTETTVASRKAISVEAKPRLTSHDYVVAIPWADAYELAIDVERGVLLRLASRFEGHDADIEEVLQIYFDPPISEETFQVPQS
jgi:hypothetical protein